MEIFHVYPVNDTHPHKLEADTFTGKDGKTQLHCFCVCHPNLHREGDNIVIVHNSFDCREAVEWANEILNQNNTL